MLDTASAAVVCLHTMKDICYHVTPRRNVASILSIGLHLDFARGRVRGVWVCDAKRLPWAVAHVANHQGVRPEDMSIIAVDMTKCTLRRVREGVWVYSGHLTTERIGDVVYFAMGEPQ